ncbi:extended synaptotagmin-1-like isoform X1 [Vespa mandarinia]|uniref:extended synaptotagmin-1-like isoform X1 n=1 Tax=Vespa mandarinia TaxID=7446 RepID=UPI001619EF14|nr:extended synaptotagmin-1-like isoform X1 [Vespa mandarinia]XP_035739055.1 extended synaptotagmin-1-like isoform X1 [Vespa mandarinia]XP_035739056.1 extended synaptotagmin-1-like isoform X1 [Vespa mandarinia]XP_035739057.1 extended synaptotagmin-1-like isoform X1 [Vespa mandarinia]XP_035739058.1 extended synaptotagmin-1-like isoform X1 [Vespa mandarinia]
MEAESNENKVSKPNTWPYMNMSSLFTSFFIKLTTAGIIWGCGYMNINLAWLLCPIMVFVWKSERQKDQQLRAITAQASILANEKELIGKRMDELPSWVYFPDFDRAEWLNRILYKVWPSINQYARELCKQTIEPSIVQKLADYKIKGFQFERLVLGRIPLKIYGIKVYDKNTSRNEIILDADVMYAGDCDITFSVGNIKGGIKNFQLRGLMRVVMKPIISVIPIIGGVQVFFLNVPAINFNLVGVADVLDLPGFSETLRKTIIEQIAAIVVLPNKIVIPLSEQIPVETLKIPEPEGILRIHVIEAKHLMKKDIGMLGKGKSDPYAIINVGAQQFRTKTIDNTVNPQWDFWCEFIVEEGLGAYNTVVTQLFDKDNTGQDDPLGRATIEVNRVKKKGILDTWVSLEQAKHGMIHLRLTWLQLSKNIADLQAALVETQELRVTSMSTAVLIIYIDSAKNLPYVRGNKQPDVYLEASVGGQIQRTNTILRSCDPVWEQGFTFLVSNPESSIMHIKIIDEKTIMIIGEMSYKISLLIEKDNLEVGQQPYDLQMAETDSKLVLSMSLSILKYEQPESTSEEDEDDQNVNEFNKKINRQESNVSNIISTSVPPSPLKKQSSKESINSLPLNTESTSTGPIEEIISQPEEENVISNNTPSLSYSPSVGLIHRTPSTTSSAGESKLGRIQLTLRYSIQRQKLIIDIHRIAHLPLPQNDPTNIPDPYVKLYLLPDKHKETKRKTAIIKDNCNPIFDEKFEYVVSQADLNTRVLEISVCTQKGWLSTGSNVMGQLHLNLSEIDVTKTVTTWYDLQPEIKD